MSIAAAIRNYFAPMRLNAREHRQANREVAEANRKAAAQLVQAERDYWNAYYRKATTQEERWTAIEELERLDILDRAS